MILVLLGTQNNSFCRLLQEIEKNIDNKNINEEVIVQAGYTKYQTNKMKIFSTISREELEKMIDKANYVISHGGVGSMITANQKGKKVIAIPRLKRYQEHVNDHQIDTIKEFQQKGYILACYEVEGLEKAIKNIKDFTPVIYKKTEGNIITLIEEFINKK